MKVRVILMAQQAVELELNRSFNERCDSLTSEELSEARQRVQRADPTWRVVDVYVPKEKP